MKINLPSVIIIAGKPGSGKSHVIRYFMYNNRKNFDFGIVMCKTNFNNSYEYLPEKYVHSNYNDEKIRKLMNLQSSLIKEGIHKKAFIIFDDCLTSEFNNQTFTDLITQHRHYNITCIISTQYIYKINPTIRECANYAIVFRQSTRKSVEAIYQTFGQMFYGINEFQNFINENTGNFSFIFCDINNTSEKIEDIYKIYKVPEHIPKFELKYNTKK